MGSCEEMAKQLCNEGIQRGFTASLSSLDDYGADLPGSGAVVIFCSTYNGNPPDNAVKFMKSLSESSNPDKYTGVKYTVMGCGNSDWKTFQAIPRLIDEKLYKLGAKRIHPIGEGDANGDFESQYELWYDKLWKDIESEFAINSLSENVFKSHGLISIDFFENEVASHIPVANAASKMKVSKNYELQNFEFSGRSTRHIELELPAGGDYNPGDHLGVISRNSPELVRRVVARFNLNTSVVLKITKSGEGSTSLPVGKMIRLQNLLEDFVELQEVATRKQLKKLVEYTICPPEKKKLEWLINDDENGYVKYILEARRSLLDLLEEFAACELPFAMYLEMLPALRPRFYSISSSQHHNTDSCSITVSILNVPAMSGRGNYKGTCSNYLLSVAPGKYLDAFIKEPVGSFRLPSDPSIPVIMIGPGTGFAPFRGFLQERQWVKNNGIILGSAVLFYGCRHPEQDFIYKEELEEFDRNGIIQLITAFSRNDENIKEYVQHKVYQYKKVVWQIMQQGGSIYICGDGGKMEPDVRKTLDLIYLEISGDTSGSWVDQLIMQNRYQTDVWASF
jgi:cytochrome P450/NADPH-cytochrome P450 reductase